MKPVSKKCTCLCHINGGDCGISPCRCAGHRSPNPSDQRKANKFFILGKPPAVRTKLGPKNNLLGGIPAPYFFNFCARQALIFW